MNTLDRILNLPLSAYNIKPYPNLQLFWPLYMRLMYRWADPPTRALCCAHYPTYTTEHVVEDSHSYGGYQRSSKWAHNNARGLNCEATEPEQRKWLTCPWETPNCYHLRPALFEGLYSIIRRAVQFCGGVFTHYSQYDTGLQMSRKWHPDSTRQPRRIWPCFELTTAYGLVACNQNFAEAEYPHLNSVSSQLYQIIW